MGGLGLGFRGQSRGVRASPVEGGRFHTTQRATKGLSVYNGDLIEVMIKSASHNDSPRSPFLTGASLSPSSTQEHRPPKDSHRALSGGTPDNHNTSIEPWWAVLLAIRFRDLIRRNPPLLLRVAYRRVVGLILKRYPSSCYRKYR